MRDSFESSFESETTSPLPPSNSDAERWSCEQCRVTCNDGISTRCGAARETADGCLLEDSVFGEYLAPCICH